MHCDTINCCKTLVTNSSLQHFCRSFSPRSHKLVTTRLGFVVQILVIRTLYCFSLSDRRFILQNIVVLPPDFFNCLSSLSFPGSYRVALRSIFNFSFFVVLEEVNIALNRVNIVARTVCLFSDSITCCAHVFLPILWALHIRHIAHEVSQLLSSGQACSVDLYLRKELLYAFNNFFHLKQRAEKVLTLSNIKQQNITTNSSSCFEVCASMQKCQALWAWEMLFRRNRNSMCWYVSARLQKTPSMICDIYHPFLLLVSCSSFHSLIWMQNIFYWFFFGIHRLVFIIFHFPFL